LTYDVVRYILNKVIQSFRCPETHGLFAGRESRRWRNVPAVALRKLDQLDAAVKLDDLRVPPGNHLEALKGHRKGQHSIRINDQWRLCFVWEANGAHCVEIVDYH
jgi:proteic killer suppression protein